MLRPAFLMMVGVLCCAGNSALGEETTPVETEQPLVWSDEGQCIVRRIAADFETSGSGEIKGWDMSATDAEIAEAYACIKPRLTERYETADLAIASLYQRYQNVSDKPVLSSDFNDHYVSLYVNSVAADHAAECAYADTPNGAIRVHDSFRIRPNGLVVRGALFVMVKQAEAEEDNNNGWVTKVVLPSGKLRVVARENWPAGFVSDCPERSTAEPVTVSAAPPESSDAEAKEPDTDGADTGRVLPVFDHEFESEL